MKKPKRVEYKGDDPAQYIWSNRTHRSASEAFRDAEYASSVTRFKTDTEQAMDFLFGSALGACIVVGLALPLLVVLVYAVRQ